MHTYACIWHHVQCISVFVGLWFHFLNFFLADIAQRYRISKYPTLKLFRNGMMMKREYRGQRSVTAIADYIRQQKSNPIREVQDLEEISSLDVSISVLFLLCVFFNVDLWNTMYLKYVFTSFFFFPIQKCSVLRFFFLSWVEICIICSITN